MGRLYCLVVAITPILLLRGYVALEGKRMFADIGYLLGRPNLYDIYNNSNYDPVISAFLGPVYMAATWSCVSVFLMLSARRIYTKVHGSAGEYSFMREGMKLFLDAFIVLFICIAVHLFAYQPELP